MRITKVFRSGNSQAIRIPKEYKIDEEELYINKIGNTIVLFPKNDPWDLFKKSLTDFSDDYFINGRNQPKIQKRKKE
ncbi:MAG: type II toxin-antitoxin system VapB family antitoxin [Spirochaetaceae bacterium]|jgi:antitoxin VapB|nr:type II toxin-antitoxin system VapB family antitoxin [Spirochaetaceae bacterium]